MGASLDAPRYGSTIASASTSSARAAASVRCSATTSACPFKRDLSRSRAAGDPTRITRMGDDDAVNAQRPTPNSQVDRLGIGIWELTGSFALLRGRTLPHDDR